jgi:hypothetical protein
VKSKFASSKTRALCRRSSGDTPNRKGGAAGVGGRRRRMVRMAERSVAPGSKKSSGPISWLGKKLCASPGRYRDRGISDGNSPVVDRSSRSLDVIRRAVRSSAASLRRIRSSGACDGRGAATPVAQVTLLCFWWLWPGGNPSLVAWSDGWLLIWGNGALITSGGLQGICDGLVNPLLLCVSRAVGLVEQ